MRIYLDILFIINFVVDALVLWMISVFDRRKVKIRHIILGGILGSGIYCFGFFAGLNSRLLYLAMGLLALVLSIKFCFKEDNVKTLMKLSGVGILATVLVGGGIILVFNLTNVGYAVSLSLGSIRFSAVLGLTVLFYLLMKYGGGYLSSMTLKRNNYCRIKVFMDDKETEVTALKDTGNFLIDDGGGNKIIICEYNAAKALFSFEDQLLFLKQMDPVDIISELSGNLKNRAQLIPFSSLGASQGVLPAFKADKAEIHDEESITLSNVIIAVYNGRLSSNGLCNGIINPTIIES